MYKNKKIDIFKLANELGFDVRGANLKDECNGIILIDEEQEKIDFFNKNRVILYNCRKNINIKCATISVLILEYLNQKEFLNQRIKYINANYDTDLQEVLSRNQIVEKCLEKKLINKKNIKNVLS